MKHDKKSYIDISRIVSEDDGDIYYDVSGKALALKLKSGTVIDLRTGQTLPMSPCPYCGALKDRGHVPDKHRDGTIGIRQ